LIDDIFSRKAFLPNILKMLPTTARHLSLRLGRPPDQIPAAKLKPALIHILAADLNERKYSSKCRRTFVYYLRLLIREAERTECASPAPVTVSAWEPFRAQLSKSSGLRQIINEAILEGKSPADYGDADLHEWGLRKLDQGRNRNYVHDSQVKFRRLVFEGGLNREMPHLSPPLVKKDYGIPLEKVTEPLRTEVKDLMAWKREECPDGRGYKGRHRKVTASMLESWICRIIGLLAGDGVQASNLEELFTKQHMLRFVKLAKEQRNFSGTSFRQILGLVFGALKHYPPLQDDRFPGKFSWMPSVISQIRPDPESVIRRSKELKWVKYPALKQIPDTIGAEIAANPNASEKWIAWMRQKQLIIKWLTVLPWRQRNLREATLFSGGSGPPNIFQDEVSELNPMDLPPWAEAQLKMNPREKLWQFAFDEEETKRAVRPVVSSRGRCYPC
jgi:hypothetical protein